MLMLKIICESFNTSIYFQFIFKISLTVSFPVNLITDFSSKNRNFIYTKNKIMGSQVINIDKEILGGTPVFSGTRVPIKNLFDYLESGESIETFLQDFESVKKDQVIEVLEISQKLIQSSKDFLNENIA